MVSFINKSSIEIGVIMGPTGLDRQAHSRRADYQRTEAFGVLGLIGGVLLMGYVVVSCLLAYLQEALSTELSTPGRPVDIKLGNWLTAPGEYIWEHGGTLLAIVMVVGLLAVLRKIHKLIK